VLDKMHARARSGALTFTLAILLAIAGMLGIAAAQAQAAGTPNLTATIDSPEILHGGAVPVRFTVRNPAGQPYGYNLSYRVVLPAGVTYRSGGPAAPTQIAGPGVGETTLIFRNVSDLSPNATSELNLTLAYDTSRYDVGGRIVVRAEAFINGDPRYVPRFDAAGQPVGPSADSYTGWTGPLTGTTEINAIEVEKDEPSWEGEILRGVHDQQTVYTVTVRNNGIRATNGVRLVDYLPAGLEFLGCGGPGADNTTNAPTNPGSAEEYPGKGPIVVPALAGCTAPASVETVNLDPDGAGPLPTAVYTRVTWDVGTLAATSEQRFLYRAAVPIRENTTTWPGATPATTGAQATNLDNNSGPETRDEQELTNYAVASGRYDGTLTVDDDFHLTRTAEDWVVHKEGSSRELAQGSITEWTLTFETSEYRSIRDATVTDTVPNGLCPLGAINHTTQNGPDDAECDPVGGQTPTAPYTNVAERADGTYEVTWDADDFPALAHTDVNARFTLRFPTRTRANWQRDFDPTTPILTRDTVENRVTTSGTAIVRCLPTGAPDCDPTGPEIDHDGAYGTGTIVPDASEAGQEAASPTIEKLVAQSGTQCTTVTYVRTVPVYHPGDRVCWKLHVTFPAGVDTSPQVIRDFLPPGATFEPGREGPLDPPNGANRVTATFDNSGLAGGVLGWTVNSGTVPTGNQIFERWFSTIVTPAGADAVNGEVLGNLMKFSSENTAGVSEPLRDARDIRLVTPVVGLVKGVQTIERAGRGVVSGPFAANVDHRVVQALDRVTYRVDVRNTGGQDAAKTVVWDRLPVEIDCTLNGVTAISDGGVCVDGGLDRDRIEWRNLSLVAGAPATTLTYTVTIPSDVGPAVQFDNEAGVTEFSGITNLGDDFWYYPADNLNPVNAPRANAPAADDRSDVYTNDASITKSGTTSVTESGNTATQATIGETIEYTVTATIPAGTTLGSAAAITDTLDSATRQPYVAGSARATLDGVALPTAGVTLDDSGTTPVVRFPDGFSVPPGGADRVLVLRFRTIVADVPGNTRSSGNLTNTATLRWTDPDEGVRTRGTTTVTTQIVEPVLSQAKSDDTNPERVIPGEVVEYTLTTSNGSAARTSTAHRVVVVDVVPVGVTPIGPAPGNAPLADGAMVPSTTAVWNEGARTITDTVASLAPGARHRLIYRVSVDDPAIGGAELTNRVTARTQSLSDVPDPQPGRRTTGTGYEASAQDTIRIQGALVRKSVTPTRATVGEHVRYELLVSIPANVALYDVTVTDLLPDTIAFDGYGAVDCVSGCPLVNPVQRYTAVPRGDGTTTIAWDLGDIATPLSTPQVVRLAYTGHVKARDGANARVVAGDTGVNVARVDSNRSDRETFDPADIPTVFEDRSPEARATVTVIEPRLSIDKQVRVGSGAYTDGPTTALSDDTLTYQVAVRNTGDAPAYDVTVTDEPDVELTDVTVSTPLPSGVAVTKAWSAADRSMRWALDGPIAPGATVTLTYTARFVSASLLSDDQSVDNTAAIPSYFGVRRSEREDPANAGIEYRDYDDGGDDSVRVVLDFPTLELAKTTGLGAGPVYPETGNAQVGQAYPWRVVVRNSSATAGARDVVVTDTLPANWSYAAGTATLTPGGAVEPTVTRDASGDRLAWTLANLAPGASVTIAYSATPSPDAADTPGLGAQAHVNRALVSSARDTAGNSGNASGPYGTPEDDATATLQVPELGIAKTPDGGAAVAGTASSFTIAVRNDGPVPARNVTISDLLPAGLSYDATGAPATAVPAAGFSERSVTAGPGAGETTIVWHLTQLAAGATTTITVPVRVAASVADGTVLTNAAAARSDETPDEVRDTGRLDVDAETDLAIEKRGADRYVPGEGYEWTLRVQNNGPSDAQDAVVTDVLPAGTTFVSATAPCTFAAGTVRCELGTVPAGYDRTFTLRVDVDAAASGLLENEAEVDTTTTDTNSGNDRDDHEATEDALADVTVEKTVAPAAIARGHQTVFTIVVRNEGPSVARDVVLEDVLPAGLGFVSVDDNRCTEAAGTITCAVGDLPVRAPVTYRVTVTGDLEGAWRNVAEVTTTTRQPTDHLPDRDDAVVNVGPVAELAIVKDGPATVAAGGQITWQLAVVNNGPDDATGVTVTDALPAGTQFVSASAGCSEAGGTVTCAVGDLAVGERAALEITATAPIALASTTLVNTAAVRGDQIDEVPTNDRDEAITEIGPSTDLAIVKQGPAVAAAGGEAAWTLVVTNNGPSSATGVTVADALPQGVTFRSATPSQGSCSAAGQQVTCSLGTLGSGASAQVQVVGAIAATLEGATVVNLAAVGGEQPDPNPSNDRSETPTRVGPPDAGNHDLAIVKRLADGARPVLNGTFGYELTVTNAGPAKAEGVTVTDTVPRALKVRGSSVDGGRCTVRGQLVTCAIGDLPSGASKTIAVRVTALATGTVRNTATVAGRVADRDPSNDRSTASVRITAPRAALRLQKRVVGRSVVSRGATVRFRIRATNTSANAAAGVIVCDRLPNGLAVRSTGGGRLRRGQLCWNVGMLRGRASRTFTFTARVLSDVRGRQVANVATVTASNARRRSARAVVRLNDGGIQPGFGRGGGVTG
jgi:uncharacterized repeat protein (TIGR01451 family)/fimbrial isopeptide formation D2 family protein